MTQITTLEWTPPGWPAPAAPSPPAPTPPAKPRNLGWKIAGGVVACLAVIGAATGSGSSSAGGSTSGMSMSSWVNRYGLDDSKALGDDMTAISNAVETGSMTYLASTCRTFQRDLGTARSHLPAPDAGVSSALSDSYGYYAQAAVHCIDGDLGRSASYLDLGASAMDRAAVAVRAAS